MKLENIQEVESEIKRFLKKLKEFKNSENNKHLFDKNSDDKWISGDKTSGALKRSSMDLTRSLSKMRNDNW
ncbi:hypothetical protein [Tenacibaculum piscium]|uniref:hypothetical protein n=1 Tax=Tenacibaculum piscium TaxID=1458515 RepID=UPI001F25E318|nr:hypothetical protein [Tenacibaculum piscium]